MQISMVFKAIMILGSASLLLGADTTPAHRRSRNKKEVRTRRPDALLKASRSPAGRARKLWLRVDPTLLSSSNPLLISPRLSMSPWTYESSYDADRIPKHIFEAKCERMGCLTRGGQEDTGLESKPIFYQVLVLRRVKAKQKKQYALQLEKKTIRVGCTCTLPNVIPQV